VSEFLDIAEAVLRREKRPMNAREIMRVAERQGMVPDSFTGKTPQQTLKSKLSVAIRRSPDGTPFVRTAPGLFYLRELAEPDEIYEAEPQLPPPMRESVLGFPLSRLEALEPFEGVRTSWRRYLRRLLSDGLIAEDRLRAEGRDDFVQIITYVLVTRGDDVLAYRRGAFNRVEDFLRGADCIGFGGHVTAGDLDLFSMTDQGITAGAVRELSEELTLPEDDQRRLAAGEGLEIVGLLNDDSSPVGRRHFAVVFRYEVSQDPSWDEPVRGEKSITQLRWLRPGDRVHLSDFEYWSQLCLRTFYRRLARLSPAVRVSRGARFRPPHTLCIVGQIGSGKSEATDLLTTEMGYGAVNSGQVLAELLGLPPVSGADRTAFQAAAQSFIAKADGPSRLAAAIAERAAQLGTGRVVVDGLRQTETFAELRRRATDPVALLYVHAPADVALSFYNARVEASLNMREFARIRDAGVEKEIPDFLEHADGVLFNWAGRDAYRRLVHSFFADSARE
jgi:predicted NUDIX family phosphoesterase